MEYFISCEGDTERWYLKWLQEQINKDSRTKQTVKFIFKNASPSSFVKSNNSTYTKGMIADSIFCRIQDIEDYSDCHIKNFHDLLKSNKKATRLFKNYNFLVAYSNFSFEVWIISHKGKVKAVTDRSQYYKQINSAYGTTFINNDDYKQETNFDSLLKTLSLNDVINKALPECSRFKALNYKNNPKLVRSMYGFTYILSDPDTTLDEFIKIVLHNAGII